MLGQSSRVLAGTGRNHGPPALPGQGPGDSCCLTSAEAVKPSTPSEKSAEDLPKKMRKPNFVLDNFLAAKK